MLRFRKILLGCAAAALIVTGCGETQEKPPGDAAQEQTKTTLTFDDLKDTTKIVMTTKAESDLPRTWKYEGEEAKQKAASLVPVLQSAEPLTPEAATAKGEMPLVIFIFDVGGQKAGVNVYRDQFEFNDQWFKLEQAPEQTYGSVEELKKK